MLREASRVCKADGRILLMEHGRGHYDWLNDYLDGKAQKHHDTWGCWWNRDILSILNEVRAYGD